MTRHFEIYIDGTTRMLEAIVKINANYHDATEYTSASCDYGWRCLSLTETLEDGTVVELDIDDYYDLIDNRVDQEV